MWHTEDGSQTLRRTLATAARNRLRVARAELERARATLHVICHAVHAAELDLQFKQQELERIALQVAALADLVESLEQDLTST